MQLLNRVLAESMASSSWIRRMFEKGLELKKQFGADAVCDFSLGNPDVPPPNQIQTVLEGIAQHVIAPLSLGYCPNAGIPEVRSAMAQKIAKEQETSLSANDIVMTVGAAGALVSFFRAVIEPGDEVIVPSPYFVEYASYCGHFGGVLRPIPSLRPSFDLDFKGILSAINVSTRVILLNSPNNPTGVIYPLETLKKLADAITEINSTHERPILIVSDEPYRVFAFDGVNVPPMLPLSPWTCVVGSFSKSLSMAGERVGYFVANPQMPDQGKLIAAVTLTNRTLGFVNAPVIGQRLAGNLTNVKVDLTIYNRRRLLMADVLKNAGLQFQTPQGAFYFFIKSPVPNEDQFVNALLDEKILVVPGKGFGAEGYVRLSYSIDEAIIERSRQGFKRAVEGLRS